MKKILIVVSLLSLISCATTQRSTSNVLLPITNVDIKVGEVSKVEYPYSDYNEEAFFVCKWGKFPAYYEEGKYHAYIVESYFSDFGTYNCNLELGRVDLGPVLSVMVYDRPFPIEQLRVNPKRVYLSKKDQMRVRNEQAMLNAIYADSANSPLFNEGFELPLNSYITSHYGVKRIFNGQKKGQHLGTDFRARVGLPIPTSNNGRVVYAGDLFYTGKTVIVDHGVNVFSVYGHLSALKAELGEYVPKGAVLGLSGATGRVSGPHLHWGIKILGHYIDGASMVRESKVLGEK